MMTGMVQSRRGVLFACLAFWGVACGDEARRAGIVTDTVGGIPRVTNPARGMLGDTVPWTLEQYLLVAGDQLYDRKPAVYALDVGILPSGAVVVLDAGYARVLRFREDGSYVGSFGGPGREPGQFVTPIFLEVAEDRIYVMDAELNRVTAFDTSGIFLSRFDVDLQGLAGTSPLFAAGAPDELYLAAEPVPFVEEARDTGQAVVYRLNRSGAVVDTVVTFIPSGWTRLRVSEDRITYVRPRLAPTPRVDASPGRLALALGSGYQIQVRSGDGSLQRRISRQYENVVVTEAIRDSILTRMESGPGGLPREALERVRFAPVVPAIDDLIMDDAGRLWVDPHDPERTRRDIFDAEGRFLGGLHLPQPVQLKDVRGDRACGVISEVSGQAAVVCYRVARQR